VGNQRPQQPDGVRGAAGAGIVLHIGEQHRLRRPLGEAHRLDDRLVRCVELAGKTGLALADRRGEAVGGGLGGVAVVAVDDERRATLRDVGGRKPGRVGDADDPLVV
jgi:hypothetical protein